MVEFAREQLVRFWSDAANSKASETNVRHETRFFAHLSLLLGFALWTAVVALTRSPTIGVLTLWMLIHLLVSEQRLQSLGRDLARSQARDARLPQLMGQMRHPVNRLEEGPFTFAFNRDDDPDGDDQRAISSAPSSVH